MEYTEKQKIQRRKASRIVAKAYEMSTAAQMDNTYQFEKEQRFLTTLTPENREIWKEMTRSYPDRADCVKQAYASLKMEDMQHANQIIQAAWRADTTKEFDDMLCSLAQ